MSSKRERILAKSGGKCWYCGCDLSGSIWHADHFHPIVRYGDGVCAYPELDTEINLVPACAPCNKYKTSFSIEELRKQIANLAGVTLRQSTGLRMLLRMGRVEFSDKPVEFWFESAGIIQPTVAEIMGISPEAEEVIWDRDGIDNCNYATINGAMVTVRRRSSGGWLAIATRADWKQERFEFDAGSVVALRVAAQWALSIGN